MDRILAAALIVLPDVPKPTLTDFIRIGFNFFSVVIGILSVVMIIYSGFLYVTSSGNESNTKKAKDTLIYALIGLVVAILAAAIVNFFLGGIGL